MKRARSAISASSADECPICFNEVPLSSLDCCKHKFCMECAASIAFNQHATCTLFHPHAKCPPCPFCRMQFNTVVDPGIDHLTLHVATMEFQMRGFKKVGAYCMGFANRITIVEGEDEHEVHIPEYLHRMSGCSPLILLREKIYDENIPAELPGFLQKELRFAQMEAAVQAWRLLPIIYTKLIIALHIDRMIQERIFVTTPLRTDAESVAQRALEHESHFPTVAEGGHQILLICIPGDVSMVSDS